MTLFCYEIPEEFTLRFWDVFMVENNAVSLILLNLLKLKQDQLLQMGHDVS